MSSAPRKSIVHAWSAISPITSTSTSTSKTTKKLNFLKGDKVKAKYKNEKFYPGKIIKLNDDGAYSVDWDNGGGVAKKVNPKDIFKGPQKNDKVHVLFKGNGRMYPGTIKKGHAKIVAQYASWVNPFRNPERGRKRKREYEEKQDEGGNLIDRSNDQAIVVPDPKEFFADRESTYT
ncbi:hypothetical protein TrLO_g10654 [Triparma laevis f. longispina]|uniref:Tudor domain-containing protein n=1 Tax=Triparma laevis f. longispina TaxID=1714387 RepID=A0A9W7AIQ1_9STRA|nr:hypothetical protein TrLO_g10654 [Triparma laevis f. longispina]